MAGEFFDCVLRAAGKAPPGPGGDPNGGGKGGPDPGDDDPPGEPCDETKEYIFCVPPSTYDEDELDNCTGRFVVSKNDILEGIAENGWQTFDENGDPFAFTCETPFPPNDRDWETTCTVI